MVLVAGDIGLACQVGVLVHVSSAGQMGMSVGVSVGVSVSVSVMLVGDQYTCVV